MMMPRKWVVVVMLGIFLSLFLSTVGQYASLTDYEVWVVGFVCALGLFYLFPILIRLAARLI